MNCVRTEGKRHNHVGTQFIVSVCMQKVKKDSMDAVRTEVEVI